MPSKICRCDGRYEGCNHEIPCTGQPGTPFSDYFCPPCDERRRTHITERLEKMKDDLNA